MNYPRSLASRDMSEVLQGLPGIEHGVSTEQDSHHELMQSIKLRQGMSLQVGGRVLEEVTPNFLHLDDQCGHAFANDISQAPTVVATDEVLLDKSAHLLGAVPARHARIASLTRAKEDMVVFLEEDSPCFEFFRKHLNRLEGSGPREFGR